MSALITAISRHAEGAYSKCVESACEQPRLCSPHRDSASPPGSGWAGSVLSAAAILIWMDRIKLLGKAGPQLNLLSPQIGILRVGFSVTCGLRIKNQMGPWETWILPGFQDN